MLNRISDFYRIVSPEPSDALITQRKEAIASFLENLSEPELQYACADIAAFGLGQSPSSPQVEAANSIIAAIQASQPSFSSDLGANALDIRVFAGIALSEHIKAENNAMIAAMIVSALGTRSLPQERYLAEFASALLEVASRFLETAGCEHRRRPELKMPAIQGVDLPTVSKSLKSGLESFKQAVDSNLRMDREELDILWWVFGGHSITLGKPFHAMDIARRAIASASELAELVIVPPMIGSSQFLYATLKEDRPLTLRQLIEPCTPDLLNSVARLRTETSELLSAHPALLPFMWLSCRRLDSGMAGGWETEFENKTHISVNEERAATNWAAQVFNECVAARLLSALGEQDEE